MATLALIGVGSWGKKYISTAKLIKNCKIKYLCAKGQKNLKLIKGKYVKTKNYKDLFKYSDIDGVILATPNSTHFKIASEFIKRGFNLLIEKPLTENYLQTQKLRSLQKKSGSKILIGHTYLFDPAYKEAKKIMKKIGKIRYISYEGSNDGPYRRNTSTFWDVGSHAISLCLDIVKKNPKQISAWGLDSLKPRSGFYDFAMIKLTFADKTQIYVKITWLFPLKKRELAVIGNKNALIYDAVADKKLIFFRNMITKDKQEMLEKNTTIKEYPKYSSKAPLEAELEAFVNTVADRKPIKESSLDFTVSVVKTIQLIKKSIEKDGKPVYFNSL